MLKYIQERFGKVKLINNEDLEPFYKRKIQTSHWRFDRLSWGSTGWLAVSIWCLVSDRWASIGPRLGVDWKGRYLKQERKAARRERVCVFSTPRPDLDRAKGIDRPVPLPVEPVSLVSRPVQRFDPENLSFFILFSSST